MPSTFTASLLLEKQATGENDNTWGTLLNAVLDLLDKAIAGHLSKSVAGGVDVTLTAAEAVEAAITLTGAISANINVIVPTAEKLWIFDNQTSGAFTLKVKTAAGTGVFLTPGMKAILQCDGTNVVQVAEFNTDPQWINSGYAITFVDTTNFRISGDVTAAFSVNRRVKIEDSSTLYGTITASSYSAPNTTVTVSLDSGSITSAIRSVALGILALPVEIPEGGTGATTAAAARTALGAAGLADDNTLTGTQTMSGKPINEAQGSAIASASSIDLGAATGNYVHITGTTAITALGTVQAGTRRKVVFDGALTLTHNATSLILPGGENIPTAAGDVAEFESEGSGNWRCTSYVRADAYPLKGGVAQVQSTLSTAAATSTTVIPLDDTKPQSTEGTEGFTVAITPKNTNNTLIIDVVAMLEPSATGRAGIIALFKDSDADSLAAVAQQVRGQDLVCVCLRHTMAAGGTSAITFKVRFGQDAAGTITLNGAGGARLFGGVTISSIVVTEIWA